MPKETQKTQEIIEEEEDKSKPLVLKDMVFEGPKIVPVEVAGYQFKVLDKLPYAVGAKAANKWLSTMGSGKMEDQDITGALEEILLAVVIEPKLNRKFIQSDKCPQELLSVALSFFMEVMSNMK